MLKIDVEFQNVPNYRGNVSKVYDETF